MRTISLRDTIFSRLKAYSKAKNIPIEDFVETTIEDRLTQLEQWDQFRSRLPKASREDFLRILHAPERDRPPVPGDEWPPVKRTVRRAAPKTRRTTTKRTKKTA